jgi:hypothetical protein
MIACLCFWLSYPTRTANALCNIFIWGRPRSTILFTLSHKTRFSRNRLLNMKCGFGFSLFSLWHISLDKQKLKTHFHNCTYIGLDGKYRNFYHILTKPEFRLQNLDKFSNWKFNGTAAFRRRFVLSGQTDHRQKDKKRIMSQTRLSSKCVNYLCKISTQTDTFWLQLCNIRN